MSQCSAHHEPDGAGPLVAAPSRRDSVRVQVDDSQTPVLYSTTTRVCGTAEQINADFAGPIGPTTQNNVARVKIEQPITVNRWAAKRLAIALDQAGTRHEQTYGTLEIDEPKRRVNGARLRSGGRTDGP